MTSTPKLPAASLLTTALGVVRIAWATPEANWVAAPPLTWEVQLTFETLSGEVTVAWKRTGWLTETALAVPRGLAITIGMGSLSLLVDQTPSGENPVGTEGNDAPQHEVPVCSTTVPCIPIRSR